MIVDSVLTNAKLYLKGEFVEACIAVDEGKIQKIGKETHMPKADEKTDLRHQLVLPGVIDTHVHLRDQEKAYKETFLTGTAAAAAGGVTTVLDMPNNSPVTMSVQALRERMDIAARRALVNVGFYSEFPANLDHLDAIVAEGTVGFKLFMGEQVGGLNIDDDQALKDAFTQVATLKVPVAVHAEDHTLVKRGTEEAQLAHKETMADFLKVHSDNVELTAVQRLLDIQAEIENLNLHFCHISTEKALKDLAKAKTSGRTLTCEATPHHLLLTKDDYTQLGAKALTLPPLRTSESPQALWLGITDGTIDSVGSDHAPHTLEEKESRSIWEVKAGVPGLETTLPLMLTQVHKGKLTLARALELLSEKPAEIFRLADKGRIEEGKSADFVVVDFNQKYQIDASKFKSKAKFSPFDIWDVQGKPLKTFVNGQLIIDEGEIVAKPGVGRIVRRAQK